MSNQQVEFFDENNNPFRFPSTQWSLGFDSIEIFDTQFINENIFEGNEITYGHQKKLNSIIIGVEGKKLITEINSLQNEISELTAKKTTKTTEFNRIFKKEITVKNFTNLPKIENVDDKIKELQATIEIANSQLKIKSVFDTIEPLLDNVINQNTKTVLSNSIQVQSDIVTEHILKNWKVPSHSKDFLQIGLTLTKDDQKDCVFCGQELNSIAKQLLKAYSQLFSQEYHLLQLEILNATTKFEKWNPLTFLESIHDKLASVKITLNLDGIDKESLKKFKDEANSEFTTKVKNIGYNVTFYKYDSLIDFFKDIKNKVDILKNQNVFSTDVNINSLNKKIKEFEFSKTRHTQEWSDFIQDYAVIDSNQEKKTKKREAAREQLHLYSIKLFDNHLDTINKVLQELSADFMICDFKPIKKIVGQSERIFALEFFNAHKVSINETSLNKPNFKNTLSESDKRVLAFAFFYSLMIHDEKLNDKIIIFDDPFSSFDSDRRIKTAQLLANPHLITSDGEIIEKSINQLIILTHESEFFKWIYQKLDDPKPLQIISDGFNQGIKKSTFIDCDIYKEFFEDKNKKDLKEIQNSYSANKPISNYEEFCVKCRKVLESVFTRKYLFDLEDEIKSRKSIRSFVEKLKDLSINDFEKVSKRKNFIFLCDNLNIELHDNGLKNEGDNARDVLGEFLKLIKEV